jgi:hypothetical protein
MKALAPGSRLNEIFGSLQREPRYQILIWNPNRTSINEVAAGRPTAPPLDLTEFVESISLSENVGFENGDNPTTTSASFFFRSLPNAGINLRRGHIDDGVIVQIRAGDKRVAIEDWIPIFTGTFRGSPGEDSGTRDGETEGFAAVAHGREERFLNLVVTTDSFPVNVDLGEIAYHIAERHMGLTQNEILFGSQGFESQHLTNQIVDLHALSALWELFFPVQKKPRFDASGRLIAVDVSLDKPATRVFRADEVVISNRRQPNEVEVNNSVVIRGLNHLLTRAIQEYRLLTEISVVTGFFDDEYKEDLYYSEDRTQRAVNTYLVTRKKIRWSDADWSEGSEFFGTLEIDTRYLRNVRAIIFGSWVATQIIVALIDLYFQEGSIVSDILNWITGGNVAAARFALQIADIISLAGLLWSMSFIGRGEYEIWGQPYYLVYQELLSRHRLIGLSTEEVREIEYRNDFLSTMDLLDAATEARLRRELVKDQLYLIEAVDDPTVETDDVIETADGSRFYVVSVSRDIKREQLPTMSLSTWKIRDGALLAVDAASGV